MEYWTESRIVFVQTRPRMPNEASTDVTPSDPPEDH